MSASIEQEFGELLTELARECLQFYPGDQFANDILDHWILDKHITPRQLFALQKRVDTYREEQNMIKKYVEECADLNIESANSICNDFRIFGKITKRQLGALERMLALKKEDNNILQKCIEYNRYKKLEKKRLRTQSARARKKSQLEISQ